MVLLGLVGCGSTDAHNGASGIGAGASAASGGGAGASGGDAGSGGGGASASGAAGQAGASGSAGASGGGVGSCNALVNAAPTIQEEFSSDFPPPPTGGTIADGTYFETSFLNYEADTNFPPASTAHKLTATISGTTFLAVYLNEHRLTLELVTNGTMLEEHVSCQTSSPTQTAQLNTLGYDATPSTFKIHLLQDPNTNLVPVYTLTKQ
jgi:hypothetical protein